MKVLIAVDGSNAAAHALTTLLDLAAEFAAEPELHAVAVVDYAQAPAGLTKAPAGAPDLLLSDAEAELAVVADRARACGRTIQCHVVRGHAVTEILALAESLSASMIVVGTHGRKGVQRAMLGSTCEGVIRVSNIPVLAVRQPPPGDQGTATGSSSKLE